MPQLNTHDEDDAGYCHTTKGSRHHGRHGAGRGSIRSSAKRRRMVPPHCLWTAAAFWIGTTATTAQTIPCQDTADCQTARPGSVCQESGYCSNKFENGGCLANMLPGWSSKKNNRKRACHSEDTAEAVAAGYCQQHTADSSFFAYDEIRIHSQNWESAFFQAWIYQIILSEILHVPVTIETGSPTAHIGFYHPNSPFEYGTSYDWDGLRQADTYMDCRNNVGKQDDSKYVSCSHVIPEVWETQGPNALALEKDGIIEPPQGMGTLGQMSWFIPRFTAARDPTLVTYLGLQGDENRQKLAQAFHRPTTWEDYCQYVSEDNCQTPDTVAKRPPNSSAEASRYYVNQVYTGHFRPTERNDCELFPDNCTGHIVDFPCGWSSYVVQQTYQLNIALESNGKETGSRGYSYSAMTEIWAAANHTKSNVMMQWWTPEALYQTYLGSDAEFQRVNLPPPTQECIDKIVNPIGRCEEGYEEQVKNANGGGCELPAQSLERVVGESLYRMVHDSSISEAARSPAYETVKSFTINGLQLGKIFDYWLKTDSSSSSNDPREATCRWVVENFDYIQSIIPRSYPRVLRDNDHTEKPLFYVAVVLAAQSTALVVLAMYGTYKFQSKASVMMAQVEFLWLLLVGMLMVSIGAIVIVIPPTAPSCTATIWLVNLGYTLELVPLIVKVAAINKLSTAARRLRRVVLRRVDLFGVVFVLSGVVVCFLILWTVLDHPYRKADYQLSDEETKEGETIVYRAYSCQSESAAWKYTAISWHALMLLTATILTFQMRGVRHKVNESMVLAILIYSHFVMVLLRLVSFYLEDSLEVTEFARSQSIIFSVDVTATCWIYFFPKFLRNDDSGTTTMNVFEGSLHGSQHSDALPRRSCHSNDSPFSDLRVTDSMVQAMQEVGHERSSEIEGASETISQKSSPDNASTCSDNDDAVSFASSGRQILGEQTPCDTPRDGKNLESNEVPKE